MDLHNLTARFELDGAGLFAPKHLSRRWAARVPTARGSDGYPLPYGMVGGSVAVVAIDGPLSQRGGWFAGYDQVTEAARAAFADPSVRAVVLKINSPGGVAAGCFEASRALASMSRASGKPLYAYADEMADSGAYALACAAQGIYLPPSGEVGSVGVLSSVVSMARGLEAEGVDVRVIRSGARKALGHPADPMSDDTIAREQADVDALAGQFFALVAAARSMSPQAVADLEGDTRLGAAAVSAGLADGVCTFDELCARAALAAGSLPTSRAPSAETNPHMRDSMMEEEKKKLAALEALQRKLGVTSPEELEAAISAQGRQAAKVAELEADAAAHRLAADRNERRALIDAAQRDGRLSKADMADEGYQRELASFTVAQLKTHLSRLTARVGAARGGAKVTPAKNPTHAIAAAETSETDTQVATVLGFAPEKIAKIRAERPGPAPKLPAIESDNDPDDTADEADEEN